MTEYIHFIYILIYLIHFIKLSRNDIFLDETDEPQFVQVWNSTSITSENPYISEKIEDFPSKLPDDELQRRNTTFQFLDQSNVTHGENTTESSTECSVNLILPVKGTKEEVNHSLKILLMLFVIAVCFIEIYFLLRSKFHYIPESSLVVFTGALFGAFFAVFFGLLPGDIKKKEAFDPTTFFLFLLPPIMYESAYNLHKGNFFKNIGSILFFAIFGTSISAFVIGGSLFLLGQLNLVYELNFTESFAFGSFLSAVDPVATLAIFQALDVDPVLNMLVVGESIINDAVAIVLASTVWESSQKESVVSNSITYIFFQCLLRFVTIFFTSGVIGVAFGFLAALLFKHIDFRKYPWMEFGMMLIFIYAPYCVAEVLQLSAIIAILFNGIVMSHYTHLNLSRLVQSIMQVTLRTMAFIAETCVYAYLGVSIFSYRMMLDLPFVVAAIVLCLIARAFSIFPLSFVVNLFREHEITPKMMFIMWFSAIRGAVSYALALRFEFEEKKRNVIVTATLVIVLFTTVVFGGGTMPLLKCLKKEEDKLSSQDFCASDVCLIKTEKLGETIDVERLSESENVNLQEAHNIFVQIDAKYLMPFFTRNLNVTYVSDAESKTSEDIQSGWNISSRPSNFRGDSP